MKLSIIIPVYNVEKYLQRCLESCIKQDLQLDYYEIIIVNDGSIDNSLVIANNYAIKYPNITIVSQKNKGLSIARNVGLEIAKGDYIWFVDSDDWIADNCIATIIDKCTKQKLDILCISKANVIKGQNHNRYLYNHELENQTINGKETLRNGLLKSVCVPFYIYRKEFLTINNLKCLENVFHEDNEFTPRAFYLAQKVGFYNRICYYAYERENSIMTTINPKRAFDLIHVANSLHMFTNNIVSRDYKFIFHRYISNCLNEALHLSTKLSQDNKNELVNTIKRNGYLIQHLIRSKKLKYKIEGILFTIFPNKIIKIYQTLLKIKK